VLVAEQFDGGRRARQSRSGRDQQAAGPEAEPANRPRGEKGLSSMTAFPEFTIAEEVFLPCSCQCVQHFGVHGNSLE